MWLLLVPLLTQEPSERRILELEHARTENATELVAALKSRDPRKQRLAVRAIGRLERPALQRDVEPLLRATDAEVRQEAINALGQMAAPFPFATLLSSETVGAVRAIIYETLGRSALTVLAEGEVTLANGLADPLPEAREGAARGLESLIRRSARTGKPSVATVLALRHALRDNTGESIRSLALLALNAAADRDSATFALALRDPSPQVRRLAVIGSRQFIDDPSPIVRYEVMRVAATCGRAIAAVDDANEMVAIGVADMLGAKNCDARVIESMADRGATWRIRAHALVSLAKVAPDAARRLLPAVATSKVWQERAWAATVAKTLKDADWLAKLARDREPNVAIAAMTTADDALRALTSTHAGLVFAAAEQLKGTPQLSGALPQLMASLDRFTRLKRATVRDPRVALLHRIGEAGDARTVASLRPLIADVDPAVAALAAKIISDKSGTTVAPVTTRYTPAPLPTEAELTALRGATATVVMKGLGAFTLDLYPDDAPVTVATFAQLSDRGAFKGLTFHRIVPNFVIQGGSPGADEYDGITSTFMRDELGLTRQARGTLGISTRGRDTGDGQIYVNMVDNFRLDHDYTVFARITSGMDVVDRVQEGDVIESIRILRPSAGAQNTNRKR